MKGYIQVYTGDGKGKTTAAFGLAFRAAGAGLKVFIAQFAKGQACSEHKAIERFADRITIRQYGTDSFIKGKPAQEYIKLVHYGLDEIHKTLRSGEYDVVILDEANIATHFGLISVDDLIDLMDSKPENVELVLTGRRADQRIIDKADVVTEMVEIKHYYNKGVKPREGVEY